MARPVLIAKYQAGAQSLAVIATHTKSPRKPFASEDRNVQLTELAKLANAQPGEVLMIGDLNTTSWSPYFGDLLQATRLRDSRPGYGVLATWPTDLAARSHSDRSLPGIAGHRGA